MEALSYVNTALRTLEDVKEAGHEKLTCVYGITDPQDLFGRILATIETIPLAKRQAVRYSDALTRILGATFPCLNVYSPNSPREAGLAPQ